MNKKTATVIIIFVITLLLAGALWFYFNTLRSSGDIPSPGGFPDGTIFPDQDLPQGGTDTGQTQGGTSGGTSSGFKPRFIQISDVPAAGGVILVGEDGEADALYMERATGRVHEMDLKTLARERVTNTTIPKVYDALWHKNGQDVVLRYLAEDEETITTFYAKIIRAGAEGEEGSLQGTFLQSNLKEAAIAPASRRISALQWTTNGSSVIVSEIDGAKRSQIWSSPLREWLISWPREGTIALTSKPSYDSLGALYLVNAETGSQVKILSEIKGLTALVSPDALRVIYSENSGSSLSTKVHTLSNREVETLVLKTLPEKCVWDPKSPSEIYCAVPSTLPAANYPDDWYQGLVSLSDDIWKIDTESGGAEYIIGSRGGAGTDIDAISLSLSSDGKYLLLSNKNDLKLWAVQMKE